MKLNALLVDLAILGPLGWEFLERVCGMLPDLGVIVCTQGSTVAQRVRGLRLGADDWIAKPSHPEEVMARIEAVVRRRRRSQPKADSGPLVAGEIEIRADQFQAFVAGRSLNLTRREFELLQVLAEASGTGDRARGDLPARLGLRDGPRRPLGRRLRPQAALQAPEALARLGLHPHPLRGRLPLRARAELAGGRRAAGAPAAAPRARGGRTSRRSRGRDSRRASASRRYPADSCSASHLFHNAATARAYQTRGERVASVPIARGSFSCAAAAHIASRPEQLCEAESNEQKETHPSDLARSGCSPSAPASCSPSAWPRAATTTTRAAAAATTRERPLGLDLDRRLEHGAAVRRGGGRAVQRGEPGRQHHRRRGRHQRRLREVLRR